MRDAAQCVPHFWRHSVVRVHTVVAAAVVGLADQRRLLLESMLTKCVRPQRCVGLSRWSMRCIRIAIMKVIPWRTGSHCQWSSCRAGVMWTPWSSSKWMTRQAAVLGTRCRGAIVTTWRQAWIQDSMVQDPDQNPDPQPQDPDQNQDSETKTVTFEKNNE